MNDDQLRTRLRRLDPQAAAPVDPVTSPHAQHLLEHTMSTQPTTDISGAIGTTRAPDDTTAAGARGANRAWPLRRRVLTATLGAAAVAVTAGVLWHPTGNSTPAPTTAAKKTTLALALPDGTSAAS